MEKPLEPELPSVTIDDLLKMIGDRDVTIARQAVLINQQSIRLSEIEKENGKANDVTIGNGQSGAMVGVN
jgi:hypothetical protein